LHIIAPDDVDCFQRKWGRITIKLPDGTVAYPNINKASFFKEDNGCPHLIDKTIKEWFRANGYLPWPSGARPKFELELIDQNKGVFRLHDNACGSYRAGA